MNPEIDRLIKIAVADGEISEKERAIILRKAETLGLDKDEVEMILEGELSIIMKERQTIVNPKTNKEGEIRKCPSCGASVQSFTTKCDSCGHEFRNRKASTSITELFTLLMKAESDERAKPAPASLFAKILTANNTQIAIAIAHKQANIINIFPLPITKEDILEFLSQAAPKCKKSRTIGFGVTEAAFANNILAEAWRNKCAEIVIKARFSMKDSKETLQEIEHYARQLGIK